MIGYMHHMIDLTGQDSAPHVFASTATTDADQRTTRRILRSVHDHIMEFVNLEMRPNAVTFINRSRRSLRIILYDVEKLLAQKDLFVVVFYAHRRLGLTEAFNKEFFETDWKIAMSMMDEGSILCYASQELADGDWFNVVLFTEEAGKHDVKKRALHHHAAYILAPKRFEWIRLHNAVLPRGIMSHQELVYKKTKYYSFDDNWFGVREYPHA